MSHPGPPAPGPPIRDSASAEDARLLEATLRESGYVPVPTPNGGRHWVKARPSQQLRLPDAR